MKQIMDLLNKYKFHIIIVALGLWVVHLMLKGLKKDHSLDLVHQEIKFQKAAEEKIIQLRAVYDSQAVSLSRQILVMQIRDSLLATKVTQTSNQIRYISTPEYVKQKTQAVDNFSDADLQHYFNSLPSPNDYEAGDVGR